MNSEVIIKIGREETPIRDLSLAKEIKEAHELDTQAKEIAARSKKLKEKILEKARKHIPSDTDTITFIKDGTECKVGFPKTAFIAGDDVEALRDYLKDTFAVLVQHTDSYKPTRKLLDFAEGKPEVQKLISTKPATPRVGFKIIKDK